MDGMENSKTIIVEKVEPRFYAQVCPNCNGRTTVGYERRPCPTCGKTNHPGVIYVPVDGRMDDYENR
jgi:hypothetical protein